MEDHPTVSSDDGGVEEGGTRPSDKSLTKPADRSPISSRRRRTYLTAAIVGLVLIVGIIVVLSLSLTGAFDKSPSTEAAAPAATSSSIPESESSSSRNSTTTTNPNSSNADSNGAQLDGEDSEPSKGNSTSDNETNNSVPGEDEGSTPEEEEPSTAAVSGGARYPTDPFELLDIWSGDRANATALTFENGETVSIRWPECVGMGGSECETLVRSTNPYVTEVFLLGPFDYTTEEFRNDRVNVWMDEAVAVVAQVPTIG
jgi:Potato inhibitor I family